MCDCTVVTVCDNGSDLSFLVMNPASTDRGGDGVSLCWASVGSVDCGAPVCTFRAVF